MERVVRIFTSKGQKIQVNLEDWFLLNNFRWRVSTRVGGYLFIRWSHQNKDNAFLFHRFIMKPNPEKVVDHINGDRLDNRRSNLRICTQADNCKNQRVKHRNNTLGYKGLKRTGNLWYATIQANCVIYTSRGFKTKVEAAKAYNELAIKHHGEFAVLNVIENDVDAQLFGSITDNLDVSDAG